MSAVVIAHGVEDDRKKGQFIQIGKTRHRVANDHHALLTQIQQDFREMSMENLLFFTSFLGAMVLHTFGPTALNLVRSRARFTEPRVNGGANR